MRWEFYGQSCNIIVLRPNINTLHILDHSVIERARTKQTAPVRQEMPIFEFVVTSRVPFRYYRSEMDEISVPEQRVWLVLGQRPPLQDHYRMVMRKMWYQGMYSIPITNAMSRRLGAAGLWLCKQWRTTSR